MPRLYSPEEFVSAFWAKVDKNGPVVRPELGPCWIWTSNTINTRYGQVCYRSRPVLAHRKSYEMAHGEIDAGLCVLHRCDNRPCVNPDHLFLGTHQDNSRDMGAKGRQFLQAMPHRIKRGEQHSWAKLTDVQVRTIREQLGHGAKGNHLGRIYGVSASVISNIKLGKIWRHVAAAAILVSALLFSRTAAAQVDEIDVSKMRVYATAGDIISAPVTCHPTSITFTDYGFPINADCLDGPSRWPDVTPDRWEGPIQFTYCMGLQSKADNRWAVSCVVQMWHNRQQQDPNATAAPYAVDKSWFYDPRWGELTDRNPVPGETVALFIVRGNARYGTETTRPRERSNIVLVKWGQNWAGPIVSQPQQPESPKPQEPEPQHPQQPSEPQPQQPTQPTIDPSTWQASIDAVNKKLDDLKAQIAAVDDRVKKHDEDPTIVKKIVSSRYFQLAVGVFTTYITTQQMSK